ncbi:MAG: hypothetical protein OES26_19310 [Gammaproteobacteria bacterium]|nr:hypothetical protein [Gammaproteobacteria bacterium]
METDLEVWNMSKWRFLQSEASLWIFGNKFLEVALFLGALVWFYFEFFSAGLLKNLKYLGLFGCKPPQISYTDNLSFPALHVSPDIPRA